MADGRNGSNGRNGMQAALVRMADEEPELAARLLLQALPAASTPIKEELQYTLVLDDVGCYRVAIGNGGAYVDRVPDYDRAGEFELRTDAATFARMAAGASPLRLMLLGRVRIRGKRLRALKLRHLSDDVTLRDIARSGVDPDPDLLYRALPYAIDPEWTRGHNFCIEYELTADAAGPGGRWFVHVDDGSIHTSTEPPHGGPDAHVMLGHATWLEILRGELTPNEAMQKALTRVEGSLPDITLMGRWIERSEGRDGPELERERRQGQVQARRATWGSSVNGGGAGHGQGDPAHDSEGGRRRKGADLLTYEDLYALWERQNWRAHEIDFSKDKEQWLNTPTESQFETLWTTANFYIGEERVAADLAPFVMAAPSGEIEVFLTTQLVDEARHAAFFDRFMAEVLALHSEDMRGRLREMEELMLPAWHRVFDDYLRGISRQIQSRPDDLDLFVEGVVTYHMVIEGVLAMTGQHHILKYMSQHGLYPGFVEGFSLVEQDEHRHIAFGVRFLKEVCEQEPKYKSLIREKIEELVPQACQVFVPPYADDPSDFVSYAYSSAELYGYAYRALKRRMAVIGVDVPPPDELMPGPISEPVLVGAQAD